MPVTAPEESWRICSSFVLFLKITPILRAVAQRHRNAATGIVRRLQGARDGRPAELQHDILVLHPVLEREFVSPAGSFRDDAKQLDMIEAAACLEHVLHHLLDRILNSLPGLKWRTGDRERAAVDC